MHGFFRGLSATVLIATLALIVTVSCNETNTQAVAPRFNAIAPAVSQAVLPHPAFAQVGGNVSIADIAERSVDCVVNISSTRFVSSQGQGLSPFLDDPFFRRFFGPNIEPDTPEERRQQSLGSGVIISEDGIILTNNHVIEDAVDLEVTLNDDRVFKAEVVGTDPPSDIAVIRLLGENITGLSPMQIGDSDILRLGDVVLAIGNPFGLDHTVSMGIVSAKGRSNIGITEYDDLIQTDAAINPGNSGGALINLRGELVGINTAIASQTGSYAGIGLAIPSNMAREIMNRLLTDGKIVRGQLGVMIADTTPDIAEAFGVEPYSGVLVDQVMENSPAEKADFRSGDIIVELNGNPITRTNQLRSTIAMLGADVKATFTILRNSRRMTLTATLEERDVQQTASAAPSPGSGRGNTLDGITVSALNDQSRSRYSIPDDVTGVIITDLEQRSPAVSAGLQVGDVISEVNRNEVKSVNDFTRLYGDDEDNVLLYVWRQGNGFYIVVRK